MTAPDLVEVVAEALEAHQFSAFSADGYCICTCDAVVVGEGEGWEEYPAHQARAVVAALTEAGTVEWGALHRKRKVPYRYAKEQDARNSATANYGVLVSRLTLPWSAVE